MRTVRTVYRFPTKAERDKFVSESPTEYTTQAGFREELPRREIERDEIQEAELNYLNTKEAA